MSVFVLAFDWRVAANANGHGLAVVLSVVLVAEGASVIYSADADGQMAHITTLPTVSR